MEIRLGRRLRQGWHEILLAQRKRRGAVAAVCRRPSRCQTARIERELRIGSTHHETGRWAWKLLGHPLPARSILEFGAKSGWGWATVRHAKVNIGALSFKKGHEWWWFDPSNFTPATAPPGGFTKKSAAQSASIFDKVPDKPATVEQPSLAQATAAVAAQQEAIESPKPVTSGSYLPDKHIENRSKEFAPTAPPQPRDYQIPKPVEAPKPKLELPKTIEPLKPLDPPKLRRLRIWDSEIAETRDALISAANFVDLYSMRADIRLRQEQLSAKGLLKEELALNDLVSRINDALQKKKKLENLE